MPDVLTAWFPARSCLRWESQVEYIIDVDLFQDASALLDSGSHISADVHIDYLIVLAAVGAMHHVDYLSLKCISTFVLHDTPVNSRHLHRAVEH